MSVCSDVECDVNTNLDAIKVVTMFPSNRFSNFFSFISLLVEIICLAAIRRSVVGLDEHKMVSKNLFNIITAFTLCQVFCKAATQQCVEGENSITGKMLKGFTFKKMKVSNPSECLQACNDDIKCQSFNYVILQDVCELNNRTKEAKPEDLEPDPNRYYLQVKREKPPGKL